MSQLDLKREELSKVFLRWARRLIQPHHTRPLNVSIVPELLTATAVWKADFRQGYDGRIDEYFVIHSELSGSCPIRWWGDHHYRWVLVCISRPLSRSTVYLSFTNVCFCIGSKSKPVLFVYQGWCTCECNNDLEHWEWRRKSWRTIQAVHTFDANQSCTEVLYSDTRIPVIIF